MKTVSIVLASFNGEKYLRDQIESIISQMSESDELIITDDGSTDDTPNIISSYISDKRVFFYSGPRRGYAQNFFYGISKAKNDIILFSDQDDIWMKSKINDIKSFFARNPNSWLVCHDMFIAQNEEIAKQIYSRREFTIRKRKNGFFYNIIYNGYYGCCMGITKQFRDYLAPFPPDIVQHDQWISVIAEYFHKAVFLNEPLIVHRIHKNNVTRKGSIVEKIKSRYYLLVSVKKKIASMNV